MFDGNTLVNLHSLINEFPSLVLAHRRSVPIDHDAMATCADLHPRPARAGHHRAVADGAEWCRRIACASGRGTSARRLRTAAGRGSCRRCASAPRDRVGVHRHQCLHPHPFPSADVYELLAPRLALCLAGSARIQVWLHNQGGFIGTLWSNGDRLTAALSRVLTRLGVATDLPTDALVDTLVENSAQADCRRCSNADSPKRGHREPRPDRRSRKAAR